MKEVDLLNNGTFEPNSNFQIGATESTGPRLACSLIGGSLVGSSDAVPDMGLKNTEV